MGRKTAVTVVLNEMEPRIQHVEPISVAQHVASRTAVGPGGDTLAATTMEQ
jgi:hypothetical protein